jgi:hypothetical protein
MLRSNYRATAALAAALTAGAAALCAVPASAAPVAASAPAAGPVTLSPFSAFTTGNVLYANAAQLATPSVASAEVAQSAAAAAGGGSKLIRADQLGVPTSAGGGTTGYGHGAGANVGLLQSQTVPGQVLLTHVDATSPGTASTDNSTLLPVSLSPLATASVIPGAATASPTATATTCPTTGTTLSSGTSRAANAKVATLSPTEDLASLGSTSSTTSTTKLVGADAQGVESQSVSQLAPLSLLGGLVTVDVLTPVALTTVADGTPGTASVSYGAVDANGNPVPLGTPVLTLTIAGQSETLTAQDLLGKGLEIGPRRTR